MPTYRLFPDSSVLIFSLRTDAQSHVARVAGPDSQASANLVPRVGLEPTKARLLRPVGVPISISHRGIIHRHWGASSLGQGPLAFVMMLPTALMNPLGRVTTILAEGKGFEPLCRFRSSLLSREDALASRATFYKLGVISGNRTLAAGTTGVLPLH